MLHIGKFSSNGNGAISERGLRRRQRASARRHFRHGWRAAAARAFTGAELYLNRTASTLAVAAACCGSNVSYIRAAIVLIQDETARQSVLCGRVPLLAAAHEARRRQEAARAARVSVEEMTAAWRGWTPAQRANFGRTVGVTEIWDGAIVPAIGDERGELAHAIAAE